MKELIEKLKALRTELDAVIAEAEIERIKAAQASVPESDIK